ncbi:MAG: M48 family metallopeptidase [Neisseria mucosa]|nr:M48 family metallopeptidase [Neisseria mucosa]
MPRLHTHTLSDGLTIHIQLKRSAKKNLILRPVSADTVSINIPPFVTQRNFTQWLNDNEAILRRTLNKTPARQTPTDTLPKWIWYQGVQTALSVHTANHIQIRPSEILLPEKETAAQLAHLRRFLLERAHEYLLPRLESHIRSTRLTPSAISLSNAKTFWGVCRKTTGIRLNWRLVGAPEYVADYVCIHELCHLAHADHSRAFWALTRCFAPYADEAKQWLKDRGRELFILG